MYYFCSLFLFFHNIVKKLSWARGLAVYTNVDSTTVHIHPPTTTKCVPLSSIHSPQNYSTSYFSAAIIDCNQPSHVSNLNTTNQVDTDVNNDGDSNQITHEICDTNTTTKQVQPNVNPSVCHCIISTSTTPLKISPSGKEYL